ncbi:MAG TPA: N-acetylmuramoyl-L-alanine amidase [Terriglobia bacterium]|nr:N-acetylmuramoyl-L-alanine amidase [Terriglobia bacterium]
MTRFWNSISSITTLAIALFTVVFLGFLVSGAAARAQEPPVLPPPGPTPAPTLPSTTIERPEGPHLPRRLINVIVIDPGHGGADVGVSNGEVQEKDLTLALAQKMRFTLESRLGSTVLLTRDTDMALTNEARSAIANNNQADLLISLHIGQSSNMLDLGSVYIMKDELALGGASPGQPPRLFLPWYLGYRMVLPASRGAAEALRQDLSGVMAPWSLPVRDGPIAVLASASMPAVAVEVGNINNPMSAGALADPAFHGAFAGAVAAAIERYAMMRQAGAF